jgi:hypothetical protein
MTKKKLERRRLTGDDKVRILMKLIPMEDFEQVLDKLERKQAEKLLILMKEDDLGVPEKITKVEAVEVLTEFNEYMSRLVNPDEVAMTDAMQALIQQKLIEFNLVEEQRLYGFDKLAELSVDQIINIIFKESQQISAVLAIRDLSQNLQEKALSALSENARQIAELELTGGNVLDADILAAQNVILATAREQEVNGLVQLRQD